MPSSESALAEPVAPGIALRIDTTVARSMNFAAHQNAVPLLRDVRIVHEGGTPAEGLVLSLAAEPAFLAPRQWRVDRLAPGQSLTIADRDVTLSGVFLHELTEAVQGEVVLTLTDAAGAELARSFHAVRLLARNEWGGIAEMPEMLAAFVLPNDPAVEQLLAGASEALRRAGLDGALDGYRSGSRRRVWEMAAAIWSAVAARGIDYALPPASFEAAGQKIRTPTMVLDARRGTCLDLCVLFAACLENAGLNAVIVVTRGHAFAGVWLQPSEFASVVLDDPVAVRNRVKLDELLLFETTSATHRPAPAFSAAVAQGADQVEARHDETFEMVIDVARARMQRIAPLPAPGAVPEPGPDAESAAPAVEAAPPLGDFDVEPPAPAEERPETRLDRWQRKLLDLTLRNPMLNFRAARRSIPILCPDLGLLEDRLASGARIRILPAPPLAEETGGRSEEIHRQRTGEVLTETYAREVITRGEVLVALDKEELERRLTELFRSARADLQEGGSNTLYLALGFLVWRKSAGDPKRYRAPLVLLPVTLNRTSVRAGFSLTLHEDEPRFNPTLVQMLEQDFGLRLRDFDQGLPGDESGVDVKAVWNRVRAVIKDVPGFEVAEETVLSTFSFAKYLMWKDLVDRTEALKRNPVVRHLLETPREPFESGIDFPDPRQLDRTVPPDALFAPLPADSSQLAAVTAASRGKDFVLIGPPGTGKSQTIANMIAQNLAEGRTVLFVAEKTAALDVVHRRLREHGLAEFCLELHSNKARKLDVLEQLRRAWDISAGMDEAAWRREADRLRELREALNLVVERLHAPHGNGLTIHRGLGTVVEGGGRTAPVLSWPSPDVHDRDALERLGDLAARIDVHGGTLGGLAGNALSVVTHGDWSPSWQREFVQASQAVADRADAYAAALGAFLPAVGAADASRARPAVAAAARLARALAASHGRDLRPALSPALPTLLRRVDEARAIAGRFAEAQRGLSGDYADPGWRTLDLDGLQAAWSRAEGGFWPFSMLGRRQVVKAMAAAARRQPDPGRDLPRLAAMKAAAVELEGYRDLEAPLGGLWRGTETDFAAAEAHLGLAQDIRRAVAELAGTPEALARLHEAVASLVSDGNELLAEDGRIGRLCRDVAGADRLFGDDLRRFAGLAGGDIGERVPADEDWLSAVAAAARGIVAGEARLSAWCGWQRVRDEAATAGLMPLVDAVESGTVPTGSVADAFRLAYARWWTDAAIDRDDVLRRFVVAEHERRIEAFQALDDRFREMTRDFIRARLAANLPGQGGIGRGSELGLLRRELEKRRRHLPLRQLIAGMPNSLTRLTPCLLMSPLSIAQYLPADTAPFDLVIFDEASQITVWDAVGAVARGGQAVIVGDPKQLSPTNFFARREDEAEEAVDLEGDLESILDETLGANLPTLALSWHYRSRHESLIAFSNHRYYGGRLVTFPSPVTEDRAVRYIHVPLGVYERGGGRTNRGEAEAIVAEVVRRLRDPAVRDLSLGVVTFNAEQQRLIEDLLDEERRRDPSLDEFFAEERIEPVMVKNLESVQGDERDVMLFSITYGPDSQGRVSMSFGPLNAQGGERRLNVAVTRARRELLVFATLRPDQIDLTRTQAAGVRDLKHFLEFAERGPRALAEADQGSVGDFESPFERAVARRLARAGWRVVPQVGVSAFRIDLGIVHPDAPGRFLAGVECDGATYHRSATARDRDKLREQVLRGLGWSIVRVWSTDWWLDGDGAFARLEERLQSLLAADRAHREAAARQPAPTTTD